MRSAKIESGGIKKRKTTLVDQNLIGSAQPGKTSKDDIAPLAGRSSDLVVLWYRFGATLVMPWSLRHSACLETTTCAYF